MDDQSRQERSRKRNGSPYGDRHHHRRRSHVKHDSDRCHRNRESPEKEMSPPEVKTMEKKDNSIVSRTVGAYIPPAKLRMLRDNITDKNRYLPSDSTINDCEFYNILIVLFLPSGLVSHIRELLGKL